MKLFLTSAYDVHKRLDAMLVIAGNDEVGEHQVCAHAEEADAILFVEDGQFEDYLYKKLRLHPLVEQFPEKTFMYNEADKPWCVLPGLYCNMPQRFFQEKRQIAFPLLTSPNDLVKDIYVPNDQSDRKWLYSFVGAASHRCRKAVLALAQETPSVIDTSHYSVWDASPEQRIQAEKTYADIMSESHFSLCPRGIGTSSYRLFETLEAGRAPVIISDQWVDLPQIDWDFAIRIPEKEVESIPAYLQSIADEARDRGVAARAAWESCFSEGQLFNSVGDSVAQLREMKNEAQQTVYLAGARKLLIKNEVGAMSVLRKVRQRFSDSLGSAEGRAAP